MGRITETKKPEPPEDLWEQMDQIELENGIASDRSRPPNSFTASEYAQRKGLSCAGARRILSELVNKGVLKSVPFMEMGKRLNAFTVVKK